MMVQASMIRLGTQRFLLAENIWAFVRLSLNSYLLFIFGCHAEDMA